MRRFMLKILSNSLLMLALSASFTAQTFAADQIKVVYHLADGIDQAARAMANIRNHLRGEPDTKWWRSATASSFC